MNNWKYKILENICDVRDGTHDSPKYVESGIPFITSKNLTENGISFDDISYISLTDHTKISKRSKVDKGDILFGMIGTIGKPVIVLDDTEFSIKNVALIKFSKTTELDNNFALHIFKSNIIDEQFRKKLDGGVQNFVSLSAIRTLLFPLPSILEQKKIAKILSTCDSVIDKTKEAIKKYQAIKAGMMDDLFTRGIDPVTKKLRPSYKDAPELYKKSELGVIPKDWDVKRLYEIAHSVDYRGKTPPKSDKGIFLITAKNIKFGYIDYETSKEYILKSSYMTTMSRGETKLGDVLITTEAPMGNVAQIDKEGLALAQRVIKYRGIEDTILNDYLKNSLMSKYFQKELIAESTGSTVKGIKGSRLHKLNVLVPKINEQENIISTLKPIDNKIQTEQNTLKKYEQIKKGLMDDLLTGKKEVRVKE